MTNYHADWFELTEPLDSPFNEWLQNTLWMWGYKPEHHRGWFGYQERREYAGSVEENYTTGNERMGRHWTFTGGSWERISACTDKTPNWRYFVRKWAELGKGNITRIDLATDFNGFDARVIAGDIMHGMNEGLTRKRSWRVIENDALGYTSYFGSRRSDVMLRCYDKGAELDLEPFKIARTEFEVKKNKARNIGDGLHAMMQYGPDEERNVGDWLERVAVGLMVDFIPVHTLDALGVSKWGVQPITLGSWLPKVLNDDAWWWNVVVPAFCKRVTLPDGGYDNDFSERFTAEIANRLAPETLPVSGSVDDPQRKTTGAMPDE